MQRFLTLAAVLGVAAFAVTQDVEKKIQRSDLPVAVQRAVDQHAGTAKIRGYSAEKENGKTYYEAEYIEQGMSKDILFDEQGGVREVEAQLPLSAVPPDVLQAVKNKAGLGQITKVESITKHGKLVAYEAQVLSKGKRTEVQVGPHGETLSHEE